MAYTETAQPQVTKSCVEITQAWTVEGAPVEHTPSGREWTPTRLAVTFVNGAFSDAGLYGRAWNGEPRSCTYSTHDDRIPEWVRPYLDPATNDIR
jgi:hypothetical protein